jgi:hypothetical protein
LTGVTYLPSGFGSAFNCATLGIGPSMTVEVGSAGLVAVYAEALIHDNFVGASPEARLQLHEPTDISGCETIIANGGDTAELRRTLPGSSTGTTARGGWLVVRATPGTRTYSLRYARSGGGGGFALFTDVTLWVMPL